MNRQNFQNIIEIAMEIGALQERGELRIPEAEMKNFKECAAEWSHKFEQTYPETDNRREALRAFTRECVKTAGWLLEETDPEELPISTEVKCLFSAKGFEIRRGKKKSQAVLVKHVFPDQEWEFPVEFDGTEEGFLYAVCRLTDQFNPKNEVMAQVNQAMASRNAVCCEEWLQEACRKKDMLLELKLQIEDLPSHIMVIPFTDCVFEDGWVEQYQVTIHFYDAPRRKADVLEGLQNAASMLDQRGVLDGGMEGVQQICDMCLEELEADYVVTAIPSVVFGWE